jgi:hypothetical protein
MSKCIGEKSDLDKFIQIAGGSSDVSGLAGQTLQHQQDIDIHAVHVQQGGSASTPALLCSTVFGAAMLTQVLGADESH